jgi:hypothetical protein
MIQVAIINQSTVVTDEVLQSYVHAIQMQITRDFAPIWGTYAQLSFVGKGQTAPATSWWLTVLDNSDQAGALGYHDTTPAGLPSGKVFAQTDLTYGYKLSVTLSHEVLEMLADPWIFSTVVVNFTVGGVVGPTLMALEVCDAVEDDALGYDINGITVSDFQTPSWFDSMGTKYDFCGHCTAPLQILAGGYMGVMPFSSPHGWSQVAAEGVPHRSANAAPLGSRRERRRAGKASWKVSSPK